MSTGVAIPAKDFRQHCRRLATRLRSQSLQPCMRRLKRIGEAGILENFQKSQRSTGAKWPKRKYRYSWPILIKTKKLMNSATREGAPGHVEIVSARSAASGTSVFYASFHQFGTSRLPARQFEELSDATVDMMGDELADYLIENIFNK